MKAVLLLLIILGCVAVGAALIGGFVYGILRRGRERDEAYVTLKHLQQTCNLFYEDQGPAITGIRQELDKFYANK
jgi:hypothetical protein